jgi:uncharacterized membrane protein
LALAVTDTPPKSPILPPHIDETVRAIARLHGEHHRGATPLERTVDRLTGLVGQPGFIGALTVAAGGWIGYNLAAPHLHWRPFDTPPFDALATVASVLGVYVTVLILSTQRREAALAQLREQLTLELAILGDQKSAKTIQLLEALRRDDPHLPDRHDPEAEAMSTPADPTSVLEAIRETHAEAEAVSGGMTPGLE